MKRRSWKDALAQIEAKRLRELCQENRDCKILIQAWLLMRKRPIRRQAG